MWEAIRDNARRSTAAHRPDGGDAGRPGLCLIGRGVRPGRTAASPAALGALALWLVMLIAALSGGERLVLLAARARQITQAGRAPAVERRRGDDDRLGPGIGMPKIYVIDNDMPNAFATGRKPESSAWRSPPACCAGSTVTSCRGSSPTRSATSRTTTCAS